MMLIYEVFYPESEEELSESTQSNSTPTVTQEKKQESNSTLEVKPETGTMEEETDKKHLDETTESHSSTGINKFEENSTLLDETSQIEPVIDLKGLKKKEGKLISIIKVINIAWTLIMAELGDKSQIAAIVIGATQNFYGVLIGTSLAHSLCTVIAIVFGKIFSKYVTTRQITIIGGFIFLIFAAFFLVGKF